MLTGFSLAFGAGLAGTAALTGAAWPAYLAAAGATTHALWQVHSADLGDRLNLTSRFVSNQWLGLLVLAGLIGGQLLAEATPGGANFDSAQQQDS